MMFGRRKHSIRREGRSKLDRVYELLTKHRDVLSTSFASFDARWAEIHNRTPVPTKLTKGRHRPKEFFDSADYLLRDVEAAVAQARAQGRTDSESLKSNKPILSPVTGDEKLESQAEKLSLAKMRDAQVQSSHRPSDGRSARDASVTIDGTSGPHVGLARYSGEHRGNNPSGSHTLMSTSSIRYNHRSTENQSSSNAEKIREALPLAIATSPTYIPYPAEERMPPRKGSPSRHKESSPRPKELDSRHEELISYSRESRDRHYESRDRRDKSKDRHNRSRDRNNESSSRHKGLSARPIEGRTFRRHERSFRPKESRYYHDRYSTHNQSKTGLSKESTSHHHKELLESDSRRGDRTSRRRHRNYHKDSYSRHEVGSRPTNERTSRFQDPMFRDREPTSRYHKDSSSRHKESTSHGKDLSSPIEESTPMPGDSAPRRKKPLSRKTEPMSLLGESGSRLKESKSVPQEHESRFKEMFTSTESTS